MLDIALLPKGGIPDRLDKRDLKIRIAFGAAPMVEFSKGSGLQAPPHSDQGRALACGAHCWSKYHWQLKRKLFSTHYLYAETKLPEGGQELRAGGVHIVNVGQPTLEECPDPVPQTEANMSAPVDWVKPEQVADDRELSAYRLPEDDINAIAWAIQNFKGVAWGLRGDNAGWRNYLEPEPPTTLDGEWGHLIYAYDFHIHGDGQRCIICASSWCNSGIYEHHIRENYFKLGGRYVFNPWTLIPKEIFVMIEFVHNVNKPTEYGFLVKSAVGTFYVPFTTEDDAIKTAQGAGIVITGTDGKIDYSKARGITL